jgi:hypothetical protein
MKGLEGGLTRKQKKAKKKAVLIKKQERRERKAELTKKQERKKKHREERKKRRVLLKLEILDYKKIIYDYEGEGKYLDEQDSEDEEYPDYDPLFY